ncbi:MAG: metallophosphoesterase [Marinilabilia sp.]
MLPKLIEQARRPLTNSTFKQGNTPCDIIGDIHGHAGELIALLKKMDYTEENGFWSHPKRKAIFVGDFTCRGPETRNTINIVRNMTENDAAYAILGNHELNVIGHFTKNKEKEPFKTATGSNKKIMDYIRAEYAWDKKALKDDLKWMRRLPFSLDMGSFRVVHAYWSDENLKLIRSQLTKEKLTKKILDQIFSADSSLGLAVRQTTRGIEINLPHDLIIKDNNNIRRTVFRIKWWETPKGKTFKELSYGNKFLLPEYTIPPEIVFPFIVYPDRAPLVFVGHYCIRRDQMAASHNVCCLDTCLANDGSLTAYRWDGEKTIKEGNFVFQEKLRS